MHRSWGQDLHCSLLGDIIQPTKQHRGRIHPALEHMGRSPQEPERQTMTRRRPSGPVGRAGAWRVPGPSRGLKRSSRCPERTFLELTVPWSKEKPSRCPNCLAIFSADGFHSIPRR